jgi:hypothetical protein
VIQPLHQDEATGQQTFIEAEGGETLSGAPEPVPGGCWTSSSRGFCRKPWGNEAILNGAPHDANAPAVRASR